MKKIIQIILLSFISAIAIAAPDKTWTWTEATLYEDGTSIPAGDLITTLYCGSNLGGPYALSQVMGSTSPSVEDMNFVVQGIPGTYFCIATHTSIEYSEESIFSNEASVSFTAVEVGKIPGPPNSLNSQ